MSQNLECKIWELLNLIFWIWRKVRLHTRLCRSLRFKTELSNILFSLFYWNEILTTKQNGVKYVNTLEIRLCGKIVKIFWRSKIIKEEALSVLNLHTNSITPDTSWTTKVISSSSLLCRVNLTALKHRQEENLVAMSKRKRKFITGNNW